MCLHGHGGAFRGTSVGTWCRWSDSKGSLACTYGEDRIHVYQSQLKLALVGVWTCTACWYAIKEFERECMWLTRQIHTHLQKGAAYEFAQYSERLHI